METSCELTGRERKGTPHKAYVLPPNNWESAPFFTVYFLGVAGRSGKKLGGAKLKPRQDKNGCWDEQVSRLPLEVSGGHRKSLLSSQGLGFPFYRVGTLSSLPHLPTVL